MKKIYIIFFFVLLIIFPFIFFNQFFSFVFFLQKYILQIFMVIFIFMIVLPLLSLFNLIRSKDKKQFHQDLVLYLSMITILLLFFQSLIFYTQRDIMEEQKTISDKQTEILDRTTQSNKADLILVTTENYKRYSYRLEDLDETSRERESLPLGLINSGKLVAPFVKVRLIPEQFVSKRDPYSWEIHNLESLNYTSSYFYFSSIYPNITVGEYNLTFAIECPYCEKSYKEENISICIYSEYRNASDECGDKWKLN